MINWQSLTLQLRQHYGPLEQVSQKIGKHKGWAGQLSRREIEEPKFTDGLKLLDLAHDHLPIEALRGCRQ